MGGKVQKGYVSVVVPAHVGTDGVRAAVASVLNQSFRNFELLIVDDSVKGDLQAYLAGILEDPRARLLRHARNRGAAAARNTGILSSKGEYVAFLDSDDVWHPQKLMQQLEWMESHRKLVSCTGYRIFTSFHPEGETRVSAEVRFRDLLWGCGISPGSTMIAKRILLEGVGPFDESLRRLEDWDWLLRCAQKMPIAVMPETLATIHSSPRENFPLEDVFKSAALIQTYIAQGRYPLGRREKRIMKSTLHNEVAAAAFRRRHYGVAVISTLRSIYHNPIRRLDSYRRILTALSTDLRAAMNARPR
jgi:glycosyltransferase involved in cell wall biosynthesis